MSSSGIYVAVIGPGGVGSIFLAQLAKLVSSHPQGKSIQLVSVQRSKTGIRAANATSPLSLSNWSEELSSSQDTAQSPAELASWLKTTYPARRSIVVDNTSSQSIADAYPTFLSAGISVITPNKKAFSGSQELFDSIFAAAFAPSINPSGGLIYHESSVGAGMPIISTLRELIATGDRVRKIEGVMSGSLSFLFNSFMPLAAPVGSEQPASWSASVAKAKELGYTEPDPRDDLSGLDVARKLVILARVAGVKIAGPDAFEVQSLIPNELSQVASGEEFLAGLPRFDDDLAKLAKEVRGEGKVLRYVGAADLESGELSVRMVRVGADSPFAGLSGSANVFSFWTERYGSSPLVVQGAGAGGEVTAMGVTGDLIKVIERLG